MKIKYLGLLAAGLLSGQVGTASAAQFLFTYGGNTIATLETSGGTDFSLTFNSAPGGAASFINDILLYHPTATETNSDCAALAGNTQELTCSFSAGGYEGTGATWKISFPTSGKGDRFLVGETALWTIFVTDVAGWDWSRLHINAFLNGESIKLTPCTDCEPPPPPPDVPEPGTLALLGLGLIGLGLSRRRK